MRYLRSWIEQEDRNAAYQIYMSDAMKNLCGSNVRYAEIAYPQYINSGKEEDANEIKSRLTSKINALGG